jgi:lipopolysaccharide assembly outer membrane protein LptD (OstA)
MKRLLFLLAMVFLSTSGARGQFGSFGDLPVEITSESTRMENGLAIAEQNVIILYGSTAIYCDYGQYNPDTRDVFLSGNVRIYRDGRLFTAERALYNLETKVLHTANFQGETLPFRFGGATLSTLGSNAYMVKDGIFTTSDSSKPDYYLKARTIRIYPKDRVIFSNVKLYVGRTPIFWYPYLYQSLNQDSSFMFVPGYNSTWGAYLLTQTTFPVGENVSGKFRLDLLLDRGIGTGFEARWGAEKRSASPFLSKVTETKAEKEAREERHGQNWGRLLTYYIHDSKPGTNKTSLAREPIDPNRYRVTLQDRTYWTDDIYTTVNINKLSDKRFLQDFDESAFREDANPDNLLGLTRWDEDSAMSLVVREQVNEDFDRTERLPEFSLEMKRQPLFKTPLFYDSDSSFGFLRRNFAKDSLFPDYSTFRADTYHQLSFPGTYYGFLSLVPRFGLRGTYYNRTGFTEQVTSTSTTTTPGVNGQPATTTTTTRTDEILRRGGSLFRAAVTAGFEASFKVSRAYEGVQSRTWGLDGLRHVVQPYMDASVVYTNKDPSHILQFDRLNRSTQLPPIDFPQFNTIDSLDNWSIVRLGVRNRFETRRDDNTFNWLEFDTFFDVNIDRPDFGALDVLADTGTFSNLFNRVRWNPLPWVNFQLQSQLPVFDAGFTEVNSSVNFMVNKNASVNLGQRYIDGSKQFPNSNLVTFGGYYRINDNWAVSFADQYEFATSVLEYQTYQVHRDLSSWDAALGLSVRDNRGVNDVGVILTFTLKDLPNIRMPFSFAPGGTGGSGLGKNP